MVQTNSALIEGESVSWIGKLVKSDEGLTSDKPDSASKWTGLSRAWYSVPGTAASPALVSTV